MCKHLLNVLFNILHMFFSFTHLWLLGGHFDFFFLFYHKKALIKIKIVLIRNLMTVSYYLLDRWSLLVDPFAVLQFNLTQH